MDDEIKTQANDELAQALASVNDDAAQVADPVTARMASTSAVQDDDFSDFSGQSDEAVAPAPTPQRPKPASQPATSQSPVPSSSSVASAKLENIKDRALSELRPLLESIDIPPQEKYDTYLMMLRASDDQSLIEPTFKAARMIEDDKTRAKALLDIIHEINYLSSKTSM